MSSATLAHAAEGGVVLERADAGPQEAPDEKARGGGAHVRHAARVVRDGEHLEEHEFGAVQRERTSAGEQLYSKPSLRSARRGGGGRVAVHPLVEQKRALERVYFASVFCKLTI